MIKKIIHVSDIHIRNLTRLDESKECFDRFIEECAKIIEQEGGPEFVRICVCGDIFESHITISNEATACCLYFFRKLNELGCKVYVVAGNHDYSRGNVERLDSLSPIFAIANFDNIIYMDKALDYESGCIADENVVFCLFSTFSNFTRPDIDSWKILAPQSKKVGIIHGDINGAVTYSGIKSDKGVDTNVFKGLDFVMAGHIHKFQELKKGKVKIVYSSSLIQQNFGETISGHGFVVWNVEDDTYEFRELPNEDRGFYKVELNKIDDLDEDKEVFLNL